MVQCKMGPFNMYFRSFIRVIFHRNDYGRKDTPLKINMEPNNHPIERKIIFQTSIFGFHVNFPGCKRSGMNSSTAWLRLLDVVSLSWQCAGQKGPTTLPTGVVFRQLVVEPTHLKKISQNGNLPQFFGVKVKKKLKPPPSCGIFIWTNREFSGNITV